MTSPAAARKNKFGARTYPIPRPGSDEVRDLPAVSQLTRTLAAPGLETWKLKTIAATMAIRPDLQMLASRPEGVYEAVKQALDSTRSAANTGTALHSWTEMVDDGTVDWNMVPGAAKPYVEAYAAAKERYGWEVLAQEFTTYNHTLGYAGTSDRALRLTDYGVVIVDVKSGKDVYADMALQLAFYANAEGIWVPPSPSDLIETIEMERQLEEEKQQKMSKAEQLRRSKEIEEFRWREHARKGQHLPMPEGLRTDLAVVVHLGIGTCELVPLDLTGTLGVITGISNIYHWKARKDVVGAPLAVLDSQAAAMHDIRTVVAATAPAPVVTPTSTAGVAPLEPATEAPVLPAPNLGLQRENLKKRLLALSPEARSDLAFKWPTGVPTFKQTENHTAEQLQLIDDCLFLIECSYAPPVGDEEKAVDLVSAAFPGSSVA